LGKFFSQSEKNLIGAAKRKAGHVRRLCGRHVERKTAQQRTNLASEIFENENTGLLLPLQHLSALDNGLFFLSPK